MSIFNSLTNKQLFEKHDELVEVLRNSEHLDGETVSMFKSELRELEQVLAPIKNSLIGRARELGIASYSNLSALDLEVSVVEAEEKLIEEMNSKIDFTDFTNELLEESENFLLMIKEED